MSKRRRDGDAPPSSRVDALSLRDLFDLVHRLNPTGRGLDAARASERYREKSRVQSELVRRFGELLRFVPTDDPNVVAIHHESLALDAAHARLPDLDEDARSAIRRALDEQLPTRAPSARAVPPPKPSARGAARAEAARKVPEGEVQARLAEGARALEEYDFDAARAAFDAALAASGGGAEAALALLGLLLDHLADDEGALAAERAFGSEARASGVVRARLALAAARLGKEDEAERRILGVEELEVADVWLALAERSADREELERAESRVARAGVASDRFADVSRKVAALRKRQLAAHEADLARHLSAGDAEAARALARLLVARFPESREGRDALARLDATDRLASIRERATRARALAAAGDLDAARTLLASSQVDLSSRAERDEADVAALRASIEVELAGLDRRIRERAVARSVDRVVELLGAASGAPPEAALAAYLALDDEGRAAVEGRAPSATLEIAARARRARPKAEAAEVAAACVALSAIERVADPEVRIERLAAHRHVLEAIPEGQAALEGASRAAEDAREARLRAAIARADALEASGDARAALGLLEPIERRAKIGERVARLRARVELEATEDALGRALDPSRSLDDPRAASEILAARASLVDGTTRLPDEVAARWVERAEARARDVDRHLELARHEGAPERWYPHAHPELLRSLFVGAGEVVVPVAVGRLLALFRVEVGSGRVRSTTRLRVYAPPDTDTLVLQGGVVWFADADAHVYALDLDRSTLVRIRASGARGVDGAYIAWADEPYIWARTATSADVVRVATGTHRSVPAALVPNVVPFERGDVVVVGPLDDGPGALFAASGRALGALPFHLVSGGLPNQRGLALFVPDDADDGHPTGFVRCVRLDEPTRWAGPSAELRYADLESVTFVAPSTREGLFFVRWRDGVGGQLSAIELVGEAGAADAWTPSILWTIEVEDHASLAVDLGAASVALIEPREGTARIERLGRAVPEQGQVAPSAPWLAVRWRGDGQTCDLTHQTAAEPLRAPAAAIEAARALAEDPERSDLVQAVLRSAPASWAESTRILEPARGGRAARDALLGLALRRADWAALTALVDLRSPHDTDHARHLAALCHLHEGDWDAATAVVEGMSSMARCPQRALLSFIGVVRAAATDTPLEPMAEEDVDPMARLAKCVDLTALRLSDEQAMAGDLDAAWRTLDRPSLWRSPDVDHLERAASLALTWPLVDPRIRTRAALTLHRFVDVVESEWMADGGGAPLPPAWRRFDLDALLRDATSRLREIALLDASRDETPR